MLDHQHGRLLNKWNPRLPLNDFVGRALNTNFAYPGLSDNRHACVLGYRSWAGSPGPLFFSNFPIVIVVLSAPWQCRTSRCGPGDLLREDLRRSENKHRETDR
jgi:hypothetical protein